MALANLSLFLYGYQITASNCYISFATSNAQEPPNTLTAVLNFGYYSLSSLLVEIARALTAADPTHTYTATANRTIAGGTQNRITITSTYSYFSLYFGTGNASNPAQLLGFNTNDYTGSLSYTGYTSSGTVLLVNQQGYTFLPPEFIQKNFGTLNVSASGLKESIVFALQQFWQVQFKYIPYATAESAWVPFMTWMIQQRDLDFTPDVTNSTVFYEGTLEDPNSGLQLNLTEMLPDFPNLYQTPLMKFRVTPTS